MKDPKRILSIIAKLFNLWNNHKDWRFTQLVSNLHGTGPQDIFFTEDEDFEIMIDKMLEE